MVCSRMVSRLVSVTRQSSDGSVLPCQRGPQGTHFDLAFGFLAGDVSTLRLAAAISRAICSSRVDLPIPGHRPPARSNRGLRRHPGHGRTHRSAAARRLSDRPRRRADAAGGGMHAEPGFRPAGRVHGGGGRGRIDFLDHAVPCAALRAAPHRGRGDPAAGLADVAGLNRLPYVLLYNIFLGCGAASAPHLRLGYGVSACTHNC